MEITEVRIKLTDDSDDRLQAFCSITLDDSFVVRDLKIIEGSSGPFVAMPSRKLTSHCSRCGCKNHLRAGYCNQCGSRLNPDRASRDQEGRAKLYADIAHPINSTCREAIQNKVISAYRQELDLAKQPGYVSRYDDEYDDDVAAGEIIEPPTAAQSAADRSAAERLPSRPRTGKAPTGSVPTGSVPTGSVPTGSVPTGEVPTGDISIGSFPVVASPANDLPTGVFQRADPASRPAEPPSPHSPKDRPASTDKASTPHGNIRRKPGFGAGILDE